ncbi:hypothetical protein ACH42_03600 [Endozoicomonas sp. (ex Bugula neritina AB1)]|nr:hypothetical protein ACH42_03600 [Endozoicomonas sp. (ex Bugula neritina AB1)]
MDETRWQKRYHRERAARKQAEKIAENKTREIYYRNQELTRLTETLEEKVRERTEELQQKNKSLQKSRNALREQRQELRDTNDALKEKAAELEEVSRYKSEFLANISHELRTPLNSLMILTSILVDNQEENLTADQLHSLQIIFNSANELLEIIEEILDMSKVEAGELSIDKGDILLSDIWHSLKDQFLPVSKEKNVKFEIILSQNLPRYINTDKKRLKQILKNLLSNAFKFTPKDGVIKLLIHKETWKSGEDFTSEGLVFQVSDTGIGIAKEKWETIFQMFKQADGSTNRKYGGTGLGLSISRKLARLMGGDLVLESEPQKWSSFSLHMPPACLVTDTVDLTSDDAKTFFVDSKTNYEKMFNSEQVLLIDDDLRNSFALSRLLQGIGLQVHLVDGGKQALEYLEAGSQCDLILLDLMMPVMDGQKVLEVIRSKIDHRMLPVIMLTASDSHDDELRCRGAGADDYLVKPIEISVLIDRLRNWLIH